MACRPPAHCLGRLSDGLGDRAVRHREYFSEIRTCSKARAKMSHTARPKLRSRFRCHGRPGIGSGDTTGPTGTTVRTTTTPPTTATTTPPPPPPAPTCPLSQGRLEPSSMTLPNSRHQSTGSTLRAIRTRATSGVTRLACANPGRTRGRSPCGDTDQPPLGPPRATARTGPPPSWTETTCWGELRPACQEQLERRTRQAPRTRSERSNTTTRASGGPRTSWLGLPVATSRST